jgi:hypothetical protein
MHISDVFPTLAKLAGASDEKLSALALDGIAMDEAWRRQAPSPRTAVLLEMYYGSRGEFMFPEEDVVAYRKGKFKLIESTKLRETLWWHEPTGDRLNNSDTSWATVIGEKVIRVLESYWGEGPFDTFRDLLVHVGIHNWYAVGDSESVLLYDLDVDAEERHNIVAQVRSCLMHGGDCVVVHWVHMAPFLCSTQTSCYTTCNTTCNATCNATCQVRLDGRDERKAFMASFWCSTPTSCCR